MCTGQGAGNLPPSRPKKRPRRNGRVARCGRIYPLLAVVRRLARVLSRAPRWAGERLEKVSSRWKVVPVSHCTSWCPFAPENGRLCWAGGTDTTACSCALAMGFAQDPASFSERRAVIGSSLFVGFRSHLFVAAGHPFAHSDPRSALSYEIKIFAGREHHSVATVKEQADFLGCTRQVWL